MVEKYKAMCFWQHVSWAICISDALTNTHTHTHTHTHMHSLTYSFMLVSFLQSGSQCCECNNTQLSCYFSLKWCNCWFCWEALVISCSGVTQAAVLSLYVCQRFTECWRILHPVVGCDGRGSPFCAAFVSVTLIHH